MKHTALYEMVYTYSKACDDDPGIRNAMDEIVHLYDNCATREEFMAALKEAASYANWEGAGDLADDREESGPQA